ncbi:plasmid pRiA4b ORF-3 family protein [Candidatus Bipolaricaulota bacterium]|nr:plasmid pRiA4b ORF-3 family protein [Candidatus Bipolaricaulota bacterium]
MSTRDVVFQFKIELLGVEPLIWRRIRVPGDYTFWDLHVAIQDAMGWLDYHLHAFRIVGSSVVIGIPDIEGDDPPDFRPGWEVGVRDVFLHGSPLALYEYDFGDSWFHEVRLEGVYDVEKEVVYPRCLDGARRCPPEDCGGTYGYEDFLRAIGDPTDPEHDSLLEWIGGSFDPEEFDPSKVHFDDPAKRWQIAFQNRNG